MPEQNAGVAATGMATAHRARPEIVDTKPRWRTLLPILISAIEHGTKSGQSHARRTLRNLARDMDSQRQLQLRTRDALADLVATWPSPLEGLTAKEQQALDEAAAVLAITGQDLVAVRHKKRRRTK